MQRAQRTVAAIEAQLEEMERQISSAEQEHQRALAADAKLSARRAVEQQRLELEYASSQEVMTDR